MFFRKGISVLIPGFDSSLLRDANSTVSGLKWGTVTVLPMNRCGSWRTREPGARSIQPKFPEISVQNSMDRFGPTGKVSEKQVHLLRWSSFPGRTGLNFGWMDRAPMTKRERALHVSVMKCSMSVTMTDMHQQLRINNCVNRTKLLPILEIFHSLFLVASAWMYINSHLKITIL